MSAKYQILATICLYQEQKCTIFHGWILRVKMDFSRTLLFYPRGEMFDNTLSEHEGRRHANARTRKTAKINHI